LSYVFSQETRGFSSTIKGLYSKNLAQFAHFDAFALAGGATRLGTEMYEELSKATAEGVIALTTYNLCRTDSAAISVFCAGTRRWSAEHGTFLLHMARFPFWESDTAEIKGKALSEEAGQTSMMAEVIAKTTGKSREIIVDMLCAELRRSTQEAKSIGLVHEIGPYQQEEGCKVIELGHKRLVLG